MYECVNEDGERMGRRCEEAQIKFPFFSGLRRPFLKYTGFLFSPLAKKGQKHLLKRSRVWQGKETPGADLLGNKKLKQQQQPPPQTLVSSP